MIAPLGQRLYLRIWLAVVAALAVMALLVGWIWKEQVEHDRAQRPGREIIVRNADGNVIGQAAGRGVRVPGQGLEFQVDTVGGETLSIQLPRPPRPPGRSEPFWAQTPFGFVGLLGLTALAVALGAYPIVRRLTQRLEAVQRGVEQWGAGDLSVRLPEAGEDEVASLAQRFNVAAERVQTLVRSHKALLANASHELRSPLARIRMGLELMPSGGGGAGTGAEGRVRDELARNIAELDQLIDEILLASRLDLADAPMGQMEEVDLVGLAAEECAQVDAQLSVVDGGPPFLAWGSARLLRRVLRNLLENARRHGRDAQGRVQAIEVEVRHAADRASAELVVRDHGPGVPEALRERIFEPFYRLPGASEREGGVGLGLALVRTITQRHGGQVRCEAAPGGGAQFVLTLPLMA
ncbi:ATP-binding protein [Hydrogenophaga sp.]|uniref:HAMP domain-containing sensor histidine kinase n=1 Tax=Hydrogenophaga sp. TaxID=1904254 RepID=UPI0035234009